MKRIHLFEIHDLALCPDVVRNGVTETLRALLEYSSLSDFLAERVGEFVDRTDKENLIDLGTGGGGPVLSIASQLNEEGYDLDWILSDQYPNEQTRTLIESRGLPGVRYDPESIDAMNVPEQHDGFRTLFNCLHHFRPNAVRDIFQDAANSSSPILVVEMPGRNFTNFLSLLMAPVFSVVMRPLIRPVQAEKWLLTYLLPVIPFVMFWDSIVSGLRAYSVEELHEITSEINGMDWEVGTWVPDATFRGKITYVFGCPA